MKNILMCILFFGLTFPSYASEQKLEGYISGFNYEVRKEMKIDSETLIQLLKEDRVELIDIRFLEEYAAWHAGYSKHIPLNELPDRIAEIDKSKIVVTACPHKDRAIIAMVYLRSKGIQAKYLTDGLIGLTENLRGDRAKDLVDARKKLK